MVISGSPSSRNLSNVLPARVIVGTYLTKHLKKETEKRKNEGKMSKSKKIKKTVYIVFAIFDNTDFTYAGRFGTYAEAETFVQNHRIPWLYIMKADYFSLPEKK